MHACQALVNGPGIARGPILVPHSGGGPSASRTLPVAVHATVGARQPLSGPLGLFRRPASPQRLCSLRACSRTTGSSRHPLTTTSSSSSSSTCGSRTHSFNGSSSSHSSSRKAPSYTASRPICRQPSRSRVTTAAAPFGSINARATTPSSSSACSSSAHSRIPAFTTSKGQARPTTAAAAANPHTALQQTSTPVLAAPTCKQQRPGGQRPCRRRMSVQAGAHTAAVAATGGDVLQQAGGLNLRCFAAGALFMLSLQLLSRWLLQRAWFQDALVTLHEEWLRRTSGGRASTSSGSGAGTGIGGRASSSRASSIGSIGSGAAGMPVLADRPRGEGWLFMDQPGESVEWINMCFRKIWRVYQRGLERWITDLLQPVFDGLVEAGSVPSFVQRLRIVELTLDHEAPHVSNMRRRTSRKDSDLNGVVDVRYTGGMRLLLMLEIGEGRWRFKIPVLVSDLDLECKLWVKLRLAPMCPWIGTISLAFAGAPAVKVQLSPYNRVRLMRVPVLQTFLTKLLTVDLPALMVLPERLEIHIPPSVTSVAEAAVGRDTIMRAVASAVLQVDSLEQALLAALPLGPQTAAGGISLPEFFKGELTVSLREGRNLPVWGFPWQSNPFCRLTLGEQTAQSRKDNDTSTTSRHRAPVWNQEMQFLVEDPEKQVLEILVRDSPVTGHPVVGTAKLPLRLLPADGRMSVWLPLDAPSKGLTAQGEILLDVTYRTFEDDDQDSGYREVEALERPLSNQTEQITDIRSAAAASSRAAVAASAAISAIAMTKAAAARAAARAARAAKEAGAAALSSFDGGDGGRGSSERDRVPYGRLGDEKSSEDEAEMARRIADVARLQAAALRAQKGREAAAAAAAAAGMAEAESVLASSEEGEEMEAARRAAATAAEIRARSARMEAAITELAQLASRDDGDLATPPTLPDSAAALAADTAAPAVADLAGSSSSRLAAVAEETVGDAGWGSSSVESSGDWSADEGQPGSPEQRRQQQRQQQQQQIQRAAAVLGGDTHLGNGVPANTNSRARESAELRDAVVAAAAADAPAMSLDSIDGVTVRVRDGQGHVLSEVKGPGSSGHEAASAAAAQEVGEILEASSSLLPAVAVVPAEAGQPDAGRSSSRHDDHDDSGPSNGSGMVSSSGRSSYAARAPSSHPGSGSHAARLKGMPDLPASPPSATTTSYHGGRTSPSTNGSTATSSSSSSSSSSHASSSPASAQGPGSDGAQVAAALAGRLGMRPADMLPAEAPEPSLQQQGPGEPELLMPRQQDLQQQQQQQEEEEQQVKVLAVAVAATQTERPAWWAPLVGWIPGLQQPPPAGSSNTGSGATATAEQQPANMPQAPPDAHSTASIDDPTSIVLSGDSMANAQKPWWDSMLQQADLSRLLPGAKAPSSSSDAKAAAAADAAAAAEGAVGAGADGKQQAADAQAREAAKEAAGPWWAVFQDLPFLPKRPSSEAEAAAKEKALKDKAGAVDSEGRPVEAIIIPSDLPLEEIAKEVARMKEESWRSKEGHVQNLWAQTVEKNDRSWVVLLCFLVTVAITLLTVVAWRIEHI